MGVSGVYVAVSGLDPTELKITWQLPVPPERVTGVAQPWSCPVMVTVPVGVADPVTAKVTVTVSPILEGFGKCDVILVTVSSGLITT